MGVHIYEWGLQVRLNPKLLLQPYRMDQNVQETKLLIYLRKEISLLKKIFLVFCFKK